MRPNLSHIISALEKTLSYERVFDLVGLSEDLKFFYIATTDLTKDYVDIFFNSIKKYIDTHHKDLDILVDKDLKFLRLDESFKRYLKAILVKLRKSLKSRLLKVADYLEAITEEKVAVNKILKDLNYDRVSLMLILGELKENKQIKYFDREFVFLR